MVVIRSETTKRNPKRDTCLKVLKVLKRASVYLSAYAIKEKSGVDYLSLMACLDRFIKGGRVRAVSTSNGVFYDFINVSEGQE